MNTTYDDLVRLAAKAQRLNAIANLQAALLTQLRGDDLRFSIGTVQFDGGDGARIRTVLIRELEAMSQEGRKELEALGVEFSAPAPAAPPPAPEAEAQTAH